MKLAFIAVATLALAACDSRLSFNRAKVDPQARTYVLEKCLKSAAGPQRTVYNDWDEAVDACDRHARRTATYCPEGEICEPDVPTHADVLRVLPKDEAA